MILSIYLEFYIACALSNLVFTASPNLIIRFESPSVAGFHLNPSIRSAGFMASQPYTMRNGENPVLLFTVELMVNFTADSSNIKLLLYYLSTDLMHYITILFAFSVYPFVFWWKTDETIALLSINSKIHSKNSK